MNCYRCSLFPLLAPLRPPPARPPMPTYFITATTIPSLAWSRPVLSFGSCTQNPRLVFWPAMEAGPDGRQRLRGVPRRHPGHRGCLRLSHSHSVWPHHHHPDPCCFLHAVAHPHRFGRSDAHLRAQPASWSGCAGFRRLQWGRQSRRRHLPPGHGTWGDPGYHPLLLRDLL